MPAKARFKIVSAESGQGDVVIRDTGAPWTDCKTVTNDVEGVLQRLYDRNALPAGEGRLFYYDSDGSKDEIRFHLDDDETPVFDGFGSGRGEDSVPLRRRTETNIEFLTRVMEFSSTGAMSQLFALDAISKQAHKVAEVPLDELQHMFGPRSIIDAGAWQRAAQEWVREFDRRNQTL